MEDSAENKDITPPRDAGYRQRMFTLMNGLNPVADGVSFSEFMQASGVYMKCLKELMAANAE